MVIDKNEYRAYLNNQRDIRAKLFTYMKKNKMSLAGLKRELPLAFVTLQKFLDGKNIQFEPLTIIDEFLEKKEVVVDECTNT